MCNRRSLSVNSNCNRSTRSKSRCATEMRCSQEKQRQSTPFCAAPQPSPTYSKYAADCRSVCNLFPELNVVEALREKSPSLGQQTLSYCPVTAYCDEFGDDISATEQNISQKRRSKSKSRARLGYCKEEGGADDPMRLGPQFMCELRHMVPGKDMSAIYPLVAMASNSKFLFDGVNLFRMVPKASDKQLFGANPNLFLRVKKFARQHAKTQKPRATPGLNEPHHEMAESVLHQRIRAHH